MSALDASWTDPSPHVGGFVEVGRVALNYLDWGGRGTPLLLLPGLGDTAHVFDALAPRLTPRHRVLALTRRGHGPSDAPPDGYDPATLARDVARFLEALGLERVVIVGHSIAGNEMSALAAAGEPRLAGLVFLDAAYDRSGTLERLHEDPLAGRGPKRPEGPPPGLDAYRAHGRAFFGFWNDALEADLRARLHPNEDGTLHGTPPFVLQRMVEASARFTPDYARIRVPMLALYAPFGDDHWAPYDRSDTALRGEVRRFMREVMRPWQRRCITRFREGSGGARAVEIEGAHHHLFFSHEDRVVEEVLAFARDCTS